LLTTDVLADKKAQLLFDENEDVFIGVVNPNLLLPMPMRDNDVLGCIVKEEDAVARSATVSDDRVGGIDDRAMVEREDFFVFRCSLTMIF